MASPLTRHRSSSSSASPLRRAPPPPRRTHQEERPGGREERPGGREERPVVREEQPGGREERPGGREERPGGREEGRGRHPRLHPLYSGSSRHTRSVDSSTFPAPSPAPRPTVSKPTNAEREFATVIQCLRHCLAGEMVHKRALVGILAQFVKLHLLH